MHNSEEESQLLRYTIPSFVETAGVYTVFALKGEKQIPLYVGESSNVRRRIGEYIVSAFAASTDFIVGEAIKFMQSEGFEIEFHVVPIRGDNQTRRNKEKQIIQDCIDRGFVLLNRNALQRGYNYQKTTASAEREKVIEMIQQEILKQF